jgi:DNA-directed RNA polymerase
MTFGYGSKPWGFRSQLIEYIKKLDNADEAAAHFGMVQVTTDEGEVKEYAALPKACTYMSTLIWDALGGTVVAAHQGMAWMQAAAKRVGKLNRPVEWTVPETGFRVRQNYYVLEKQQVRTCIGGQVFKPSVFSPTTQIKEHKQANAIAPNFVHSLDATCLMLTVLAAAERGVQSFGMIHDSYATVPADCETLAQVTRSEFVRFYTDNDVVEALYQQLLAQSDNDPEMPKPPRKGSLDLSGVIASKYFFA